MTAVDDLVRETLLSLRPPPRLTVSQWADANRQLSRAASAEPGQWRTSRAEYQRGIMDAISDRLTHTVVIMSSSQVGKSEILLNAVGYFLEHDPCPILVLQPTGEMAETFSKDRLAPMLAETPSLRGVIADPRSRDSENTILHKRTQAGDGAVTLVGVNSPSPLSSRPIRAVFADEVDRYPASAGTEGDPIALAKARTKTFPNRKIILTSTPTLKGFSRIEAAYEESDQRVYHVPCPACGAFQRLLWRQVVWDTGQPRSALLRCFECDSAWSDAQRWAAIRRGHWIAGREFRGVAGFHLSELYSPWARIADIAEAFVLAKESRSAERLRAFVNTSLGETWETDGEKVDDSGVMARAEEWEGEPDGVLVRTAGVDVQDDRVEVELVGWGVDEESWSLDYRVIFGDPSGPVLWADLDRYLLDHAPAAVCVDSGGHHTQAVYRFAKERYRRRVFAIKGMAGPGRPVWPKKANKGARNSAFFLVGVDAAKDQIFAHLKLSTPGPGFCHFPKDRDERYFAGLASETVVTKYSKGFPVREYRRRSNARNEPLDCRVYSYCALASLNIRWARLAAQREIARDAEREKQQPTPKADAPRPAAPSNPRYRRVGSIGGFR